MKPDWKDAPAWANWVAMDESGAWWWYAEEPEQDESIFSSDYQMKMFKQPHWKLTLDKRPEPS